MPNRKSQFPQPVDCTLEVFLGAFKRLDRSGDLVLPTMFRIKTFSQFMDDELSKGITRSSLETSGRAVKVSREVAFSVVFVGHI